MSGMNGIDPVASAAAGQALVDAAQALIEAAAAATAVLGLQPDVAQALANSAAALSAAAAAQADADTALTEVQPIIRGGTGATTAANARAALGVPAIAESVGGAWADVTASRAAGTAYVNSTAKNKVISGYATNTTGGAQAQITIGGLVVWNCFPASNGAPVVPFFAIVPPGASITLTLTGCSLNKWFEQG